jgi:hypothetical protein
VFTHPYRQGVARTSPAGDEVQLASDHVGSTVAHLERRIFARFGERGLTKAARDLGHLVVLVQSGADKSHDRLRRRALGARAAGIAIVAVTLVALVFSLRSAVVDGLPRTTDWVPLVESVIQDLVFAAIAVVFLWALADPFGAAPAIAAAPPAALAGARDRYAPALQGSRAAEPQLHADPAEHRARPGRGPAVSLPHLLLGDVEPDREDVGAMWRAQHDGVVVETISTIQTLTTELSNKIWQKISLLPRP